MQAFRGGKYERNRIRGTEQRSANFFADGKRLKEFGSLYALEVCTSKG